MKREDVILKLASDLQHLERAHGHAVDIRESVAEMEEPEAAATALRQASDAVATMMRNISERFSEFEADVIDLERTPDPESSSNASGPLRRDEVRPGMRVIKASDDTGNQVDGTVVEVAESGIFVREDETGVIHGFSWRDNTSLSSLAFYACERTNGAKSIMEGFAVMRDDGTLVRSQGDKSPRDDAVTVYVNRAGAENERFESNREGKQCRLVRVTIDPANAVADE